MYYYLLYVCFANTPVIMNGFPHAAVSRWNFEVKTLHSLFSA